MSDLSTILDAFEEAKRSGEPLALATVVNVSGFTYRRPGARMLIINSRADSKHRF
ncbi:MAG: XdhC family protein [Stenomitos rutilans HA7619-LM2]|nr:XdhC family protein [Stenomitos rutilans HA7619-LM2]